MKRFRFRLQTLLTLKKRREEELKRNLAEKNNEILRAQRRLLDIRGRLAEFLETEKRQRAKAVTALALRASITYRYKLQTDIASTASEIGGLKQQAHDILQLLTEAKKESRALEIVREKRLLEWKRENKAQEQEFIDDVSQKEFLRKTRTATLHASS